MGRPPALLLPLTSASNTTVSSSAAGKAKAGIASLIPLADVTHGVQVHVIKR